MMNIKRLNLMYIVSLILGVSLIRNVATTSDTDLPNQEKSLLADIRRLLSTPTTETTTENVFFHVSFGMTGIEFGDIDITLPVNDRSAPISMSEIRAQIETVIKYPLNPCKTNFFLHSVGDDNHDEQIIGEELILAATNITATAAELVVNMSVRRRIATHTELILDAFRDTNMAELVTTHLKIDPTAENACLWRNHNSHTSLGLNIMCERSKTQIEVFVIRVHSSESQSGGLFAGSVDFACFPDSIKFIKIRGQTQLQGSVDFQYLPRNIKLLSLISNSFSGPLHFGFDSYFWPSSLIDIELTRNQFNDTSLNLQQLPLSLLEFQIAHNRIAAHVAFGPFLQQENRKIAILDLSYNAIYGDLEFANTINAHSFQYLDISGNAFDANSVINVDALRKHVEDNANDNTDTKVAKANIAAFDFYFRDMIAPEFGQRLQTQLQALKQELSYAKQSKLLIHST